MDWILTEVMNPRERKYLGKDTEMEMCRHVKRKRNRLVWPERSVEII